MCDMTHWHVYHDSFIRVSRIVYMCDTWLIYICNLTHSYTSHDSCICVTWLIHLRDKKKAQRWWWCGIWRGTWLIYTRVTCVPCLIDMCTVTHSHVYHDSFTCVIWLIDMCTMTHQHVCYMSHSCVWHVSWVAVCCSMCNVLQCVAVCCSVLQCVAVCVMCCSVLQMMVQNLEGDMTHLHVCYVSHSCVWHVSFMCVTWALDMSIMSPIRTHATDKIKGWL